jgi:hypothetical protein
VEQFFEIPLIFSDFFRQTIPRDSAPDRQFGGMLAVLAGFGRKSLPVDSPATLLD